MKVEKYDGSQERRLVTALVTNDGFLAHVASKWEKEGLFKSRWANLIGNWCVDFHRRYGKAPKQDIEGIFESWVEDHSKSESAPIIEKYLSALSGEHQRLLRKANVEHLVSSAVRHFNQVKLGSLLNAAQDALDEGSVEEATKKIQTFAPIEANGTLDIDPLWDRKARKLVFEEKREVLVKYPGALGNFFGMALERDGFIAFESPEKRGKSMWLMDVAWRALLQGKNVAFFEVGDMSQNQLMRRLLVRMTKLPILAGPIFYPTYIEPGSPHAVVTREKRELAQLNEAAVHEAAVKLREKHGLTRRRLRISCHPNSSISVLGIATILDRWKREQGWQPDCVILDYSDILAPIHGGLETREQVNQTWQRLRGLSQSLHCLIVTATQTNAASYLVETVDRSHFSEDKRKLAHVTGMVGINCTKEEKAQGLMRLNWVVLREGEFNEAKCVHVAGCLALANPAIVSCFDEDEAFGGKRRRRRRKASKTV